MSVPAGSRSPASRRRLLRVGVAGWILLAAGLAAHSADAPFPYRLAVRVDYGEPQGPESLRDELSLAVISAVERAGCYAAVEPQRDDTEADLLLVLQLDELEDRMLYESSIAQRTSRNSVPQEEARRVVARLGMDVTLWLLLPNDAPAVRRQAFHKETGYRPMFNEDPRYEVQVRLVEEVARNARAFACKGSSKKLARQIARAREAAR